MKHGALCCAHKTSLSSSRPTSGESILQSWNFHQLVWPDSAACMRANFVCKTILFGLNGTTNIRLTYVYRLYFRLYTVNPLIQPMDKFTEYNAGNLLTHNVRYVRDMPYAFVHRSHPIISLLRDSASQILLNPADIGTREWTKISHKLIHTCCDELRTHIFMTV